MRKLSYTPRLARHIVRFAWENKAWWLVPFLVVLGLAATIAWAGGAAAPMIYTLF